MVENTQWRTTAHVTVIVPLYAGSFSLVIAHIVGQIVSGVRVSVSF